MSRIDDQAFVRDQYESEAKLAARKAVHTSAEGPDPRDVTFAAVAAARPRRVLEVGGGEGELAERILHELQVELVALDQSERMIEIQREKGIDARVGDVQELPFEPNEFDVVLAAWMLYHVPDFDRALAEIVRVLRPGGRLVATVNGYDHMRELWDLMGRDRSYRRSVLSRENGDEILRRHFARVDRQDLDGWLTMDEEAVRSYVSSWPDLGSVEDVPALQEPLRVLRTPTVFVAEKGA